MLKHNKKKIDNKSFFIKIVFMVIDLQKYNFFQIWKKFFF